MKANYYLKMGAKASTEAIEEATPDTGIHTNDGLHFITFNLDSNNDGQSVHPSSLLFVIGLTIVGFVILCRFLKCLKKKHQNWSERYEFTRRPETDIELGPMAPIEAAAPAQAGPQARQGPEPGRQAPAPPN